MPLCFVKDNVQFTLLVIKNHCENIKKNYIKNYQLQAGVPGYIARMIHKKITFNNPAIISSIVRVFKAIRFFITSSLHASREQTNPFEISNFSLISKCHMAHVKLAGNYL
jgi:hypothetical protein